jgi:hypothetical protein
MLLRRFMTHIQSQNWFAVGLDITVVVVGIFLGLQATEWNEQRKENEEEKIILARLYDESFAIIQSLNGTILSHEENINAMEIAVKALEKKSLEGVDRNALRRGILTVIYFDALSLPRTVYDELTSTGKLGLLKSKTVTESIANYYARLNWLDRQVDFYRQSSDSSLQAAGNAISRFYAPEEQQRKIKYRVDVNVLSQNDTYINELLRSYSNQYVFQRWRKGLLNQAKVMCESIAEQIDKDCNNN